LGAKTGTYPSKYPGKYPVGIYLVFTWKIWT